MRKRRRYAAGGALEKRDMGDFSQSDQLRSMVRAVQDYYAPGATYADPRKTDASTTALRAPAAVRPAAVPQRIDLSQPPRRPPAPAQRFDLETMAADQRPAIWAGVREQVRPDAPQPEETYMAGLGDLDALKLSRQIMNRQRVSPEQARANRRQTLHDVASMTPIIGNVMAGEDAARSGATAMLDLSEGNYRGAGKNGLLALLSAAGAITGMPTGKLAGRVAEGAKDSAAVFLPATGSKLEMARTLAERPAKAFNRLGGQTKGIYDQTGVLVGPEGAFRREIIDSGMTPSGRKFVAGDEAPLSDVINHPELFRARPDLAEHPVEFTKFNPADGNRHARTVDGGTFALTEGGKPLWLRQSLAKLLGYKIGDEANFAAAARHGTDGTNQIDHTITAVRNAISAGEVTPSAAAQYLTRLHKDREKIGRIITEASTIRSKSPNRVTQGFRGDEKLPKKELDRMVGRLLGRQMSGNIEAHVVRERAIRPTDAYPYEGMPSFSEQITLPTDFQPERLAEFVRNWSKYGAGKQQFATGGSVRRNRVRSALKLAAGGFVGDTGGREDAVPVAAAEGSYVIPADVVAALGEGNSMAGFKRLEAKFPKAKQALKHGGGVDIIVSDGEFIVTPDQVAALGGGDLEHGHAILASFVKKTRSDNIEELKQLPGPK